MSTIQDVIRTLIKQSLNSTGISSDDTQIVLEHPSDLTHGDYSCNIAMRLAKDIGKNPKELAEQIVAEIPESKHIKRVEIAGPGFINFYLSVEFFKESVEQVSKMGDEWGNVDIYKGKDVLIEHSSPNLFKPFHIGHLVNNTYGEALMRLVQAAGASVVPLSFPSDVSPGIAKAVWGILDSGAQEGFTLEQIGEAYVSGTDAYKKDGDEKTRIDEINTNIYKKNIDTQEWIVYQKGRDMSLEYFKYITGRLGSQFDKLIFETEAEEVGKETVLENTPGVFEESEGAVIFRGSEYGLFDNVYINSAGFGTYLAKDTGLLSIKFSTYNFDTSITVTDAEQRQHFELVKKSAELINPEWAEKSLYLQHGRLALTTGRISSRSGGVPLADDILNTVRDLAQERSSETDGAVDKAVAEKIAISAVKYAIVRVGMGKNIVFDLEKSLSFEGDSGPYLQYTYARCKSVLTKAYPHRDRTSPQVRVPRGWNVTDIERLLYRYPEVVERSATEYEPHHIANYLNELASAYNSWYAQGKILDGTDAEHYKLALTEATANTIKNGLYLLGIDTVEKM